MPQSRRDYAPMQGTVDTTGMGGSNDAALRASARYFDEDVPRVPAGEHDYDDGSGRAFEQTHGSLTAEQQALLAETSGKDEGQLARFTGSRRGDPEWATSDEGEDFGAIGTFGGAVRRGGAVPREAEEGDEEPQVSTTEARRAAETGEFRAHSTEGSGVPDSPTGQQGALEDPQTVDEPLSEFPHVVAGLEGPRTDQPGGERGTTPEERGVTQETEQQEAEGEQDDDASGSDEDGAGAEETHGLPEGTLDTVKSAKDYVNGGGDDAERKARAQAVLDAEPADEEGGRSTLIDFCNDVLSEDEDNE